MGQTLTHGVYLPDEGERNCYNGLAANWQILDTSVGTIAEHTTQIAGKANAVHTHTKADITDFPAYGTTAGTICEGNDSRLSDARTPVAHTHTKSDVTDLFNSANTWTGEQTVLNNFYVVKENNYELGQSYPNGNHLNGLHIKDKNGATVGLLDIMDRSYGNMEMRIRVQQKFDPGSNNRSTSGTILFNELIIGIASNKTNYIGFNADLWGANHNLGTSTNKWKSLNGINPGALSFPRMVEADSRELDRTNWDYTGTNWNTLNTSAMTGWGYIYIEDCGATDFILVRRGTTGYNRLTQSANPVLDNNGKYYLYIIFPIVQNTNTYTLIRTSGTVKTSVVYPCQGTILNS